MARLQFAVSDDVAAIVRARAKASELSVAAYLADVVTRHARDSWPARFFEDVVGGWNGGRLARPPQGAFEKRAKL